jgi:polyisoprenoid-binding protein YceI
MSTTTTTTNDTAGSGKDIPGYTAGTWTIDQAHSEISFTVRHMMVSKVRGRFTSFEGTIVTAAEPEASSVEVRVDLSSIDTDNEARDNHLRSGDFFEVDTHPAMTFRSTAVRRTGDGFVVEGELSLHGVTKPVSLEGELNGFVTDPYGKKRVGFSATTQLSRKEFGIDIEMPMDGGGVVVGDKITVNLEVEAVLEAA